MTCDKTHREIALVLVGVALARGDDRQRVLSALSTGCLPADLEAVISAIREKKAGPVKDWLGTLSLEMAKGTDVLDVLIDAMRRKNLRAELNRRVSELFASVKIEDLPAIQERIKTLSELMEEMS